MAPKCDFKACPAAAALPTSTPPATATSTAVLESGIEGIITLGPSCPVQNSDPACDNQPYRATIKVLTDDGQKQLTRFTSGKDGKFKVKLSPGSYLLEPVNPGVYPRAGMQEVTVKENKFTHVSITYDTGIR